MRIADQKMLVSRFKPLCKSCMLNCVCLCRCIPTFWACTCLLSPSKFCFPSALNCYLSSSFPVSAFLQTSFNILTRQSCSLFSSKKFRNIFKVFNLKQRNRVKVQSVSSRLQTDWACTLTAPLVCAGSWHTRRIIISMAKPSLIHRPLPSWCVTRRHSSSDLQSWNTSRISKCRPTLSSPCCGDLLLLFCSLLIHNVWFLVSFWCQRPPAASMNCQKKKKKKKKKWWRFVQRSDLIPTQGSPLPPITPHDVMC